MTGETIANRYKIQKELFQDSVSITYRAEDIQENQPVLLKIFKEKAEHKPLELILRFRREVEQVFKIDHPNILKIYTRGEYEGKDYVVSEYFEAQSLKSYLKGSLDIDEAVNIILQLASGLDLAHQKGIIHRSINPSSILVSRAEGKISKLTDFGIGLLIDLSLIHI